MKTSFDLEPKHNSTLSHRQYLPYLPSSMENSMKTYHPTAIYYRAPPADLAKFFSYAFQEKSEQGELFDIVEIKTDINLSSPYKEMPKHMYSIRASTIEGITFFLSILDHEKFHNSVILIAVNNRIKIMTLINDINKLVDLAFQYWANIY